MLFGFMLTCKEAGYLVSQSLDRELPFFEKVKLRVHLAMCKTCSRYRDELISINAIVKKASPDLSSSIGPDIELPEASKNKIKEYIAQYHN